MPAQTDILPGTLDLLILKVLSRGALHGYGIAQRLLEASDNALAVGEGSLYPALQRLLVNGWAKAQWAQSDTGRRARFYELTAAGKKRLEQEERDFDRMVATIRLVLKTV
jgi:transcriptional regulator